MLSRNNNNAKKRGKMKCTNTKTMWQWTTGAKYKRVLLMQFVLIFFAQSLLSTLHIWTKLYIWLVQKAEFLQEHFQEETTIFLEMPKISTFERNYLSGNSVSFRLMKGEKFNDLLIIERVDYYCENIYHLYIYINISTA